MSASGISGMAVHQRDTEEWFFDSIRSYEKLHMFDLSYQVIALCWTGQDRLCVSCEETGGGSELIELSIPSKLLAPDEGLVKDRDFDLVSGVKCDKKIQRVARAKNRKIVTSENGENLIRVWTLADESAGLIKPVSIIHNPCPDELPACIGASPEGVGPLMFGSRISNICAVDIETSQVTSSQKTSADSTPEEILCGIQFVSEHVFQCCSRDSGLLWVGDVREGPHKMTRHEWKHGSVDKDISWTFDTRCSGETLRCSTNGCVYLSDLSDPRTVVKQADINSQPGNCRHVEAKFCPQKIGVISVADDGGVVSLFNTEQWDDSRSKRTAMFCHEGHAVNSEDEKVKISTHIWHPTIEDLVLSAATDGSLHAWCYSKAALKIIS